MVVGYIAIAQRKNFQKSKLRLLMLEITKKAAGAAFPWLRDYRRARRGFRRYVGYNPHIFMPRTFNEKVQWRKLFDRNPVMVERADKILAKHFVERTLGPEWIIPTIWYGRELPNNPNWPIPFVIKATHGSAMNKFVRTASELDWHEIRRTSDRWLRNSYGSGAGEWLYSRIQPRLLVEPFIGEPSALPIDYKLWTFGGRVEFIQVDTHRETDHKRTMLDRKWTRLPFTMIYSDDPNDIRRPSCLDKMIQAAETLSENIDFVRIDFYEINERPLFGEMTFYPDAGWGRFHPPEYDLKIGRLWHR